MMDYYPINLRLDGKKAVVIGGGKIAQRKVVGLMEARADITVISPELTDQLKGYAQAGVITWKKKAFSARDIQDAFLIIAATNQPEINLSVQKAAEPNQLISLVDHPEESNFILPSVVKRGRLSIAVSTSGASPTLAKKIKQEIADRYGSEYTEYVDFLFTSRKYILQEIEDPELKQTLLSTITEPSFLHSESRQEDFMERMNRLMNREN
ncbi:NAD(P)-binding protein [Bacillus sp. V3B]|uniref:NAD(P)-binding protein n=1 Tax=Bacillus sp. V3B TaxID=2804915 RepID=UPI00210A7E6C|nr:NAD(P)-binding protein [Bacillus sp. V3B]MCQ6275189.1 NAD(P)-binding protein [Bacillus sp. V3B]